MLLSRYSAVIVSATVMVLDSCKGSFARVSSSDAQKWKLLYNEVAVWDVGPLPLVTMDMENTVHYQLNSTPATDTEWAALTPNNGIIHLEEGNFSAQFLPSIFHQLRCLDVIRLAYVNQEHPKKVEIKRRHYQNGGGVVSDIDEDPQARHCLHYLKQTLLCRSDLHLEPVVSLDPDLHAVSQRRAQTCKDWTVVYDALKKNQELFNGGAEKN